MRTNREKELNNTERMEICYISQDQLNYLNNYNEKHGSEYRWDADAMRAFFIDMRIDFEDIEGWVPCFIYVDRITYNSNYSTYCFPIVFGKSVCNVYAFAQYVAVPDDVDKKMVAMRKVEELPS